MSDHNGTGAGGADLPPRPGHAGCGDGPVPRWWVYIFLVTIVWSVVYWIV